jgi:hypothetical protein
MVLPTGRMVGPTRYESVCHPLYLAVAGGLNLPPLVFGILGFTPWCSYFSSWLVGNACLTGLNMVAALYSVYKIRRIAQPPPLLDEPETRPDIEKPEDDTESNNETSEELEDDSDDSEVSEDTRGCFSTFIHRRTKSSDRIRHLLCYDGVMTTSSILFLFWVFWISDGIQRNNDVDLATDDQLEGCLEYHERYVHTSLVFGFSYFVFVCLAVISSRCWR